MWAYGFCGQKLYYKLPNPEDTKDIMKMLSTVRLRAFQFIPWNQQLILDASVTIFPRNIVLHDPKKQIDYEWDERETIIVCKHVAKIPTRNQRVL